MGLYVRLTITETPAFRTAVERRERVKVPIVDVFHKYLGPLVIGVMMSLSAFVLFYLMTVFAISWGTSALGFSRERFLIIQLIGIVFFGLTIPISAVIAEKGRRRTAIWVNVLIGIFGFALAPLFSSGTAGATTMMILGMCLIGFVYGPLGTMLSELFPTSVRYSGSSLTFNIAGILGASLAPYAATALARTYGLSSVGLYLSGAAVLTLVGVLLSKETRDQAL
jgi:MFS family permease